MAQNPEVFWLFILLVPMIIIMLLQYLNGRMTLVKTSGEWRSGDYYDLYTIKWFFTSLGFLLFLVFTVLSLAGYPGRGYPVGYEPSGSDIIFVVDVSESMKAEDIQPSRLAVVSRVIRSVCENTPGGRFGLVIFKGRGVKIIPSTEDVEAVFNFLNYLSTDLISSPGSNIQLGLAAAVNAFPSGEEREKYIILLSDGEALSGDLDEVLSRAVASEVTIYCAGAGTVAGAAIPTADGGFLKDPAGETVISRMNEQSLRYIADSTAGRYYNILDNSLLPDLIALAGGGGIKDTEEGYRIVTKERYRFFLVFALMGLLIARIVKVVRWKNFY
ncbi:MAG: VWA domain-containing protein [Spirochaetales bacterium]|nr:VWA domain-containing protein [Spirochaetales bacterium]